MSILPKIEKVTRDATISHFFLMFGYRIFSLYFPLFLVSRGFSLLEVGYTYLLIYLPIALFSPIIGFLNHRVNPTVLASLGVLGYALYAIGMILIQNQSLFYFFQILLGFSAALFFVSARAILMASKLENPDRAFGWFYSAPYYAGAIAPAVGAFFIWQFNFSGVFIFSLVIQLFTALFVFLRLKKSSQKLVDQHFNFQKFLESYQSAFQVLTKKNILPWFFVSFSVLLLGGFYQGFFVLFLKQLLGWSQNSILAFVSLFSTLFLPLSLFVIHRLGKLKSEINIFQGAIVAGLFSILFGAIQPILGFVSVLLIRLGQGGGDLICESGRSGLVSEKLREKPEEAGAIDTIFSPLGSALGALIGGLLIVFLGYQLIFILGGILILGVGILGKKFAKI